VLTTYDTDNTDQITETSAKSPTPDVTINRDRKQTHPRLIDRRNARRNGKTCFVHIIVAAEFASCLPNVGYTNAKKNGKN